MGCLSGGAEVLCRSGLGRELQNLPPPESGQVNVQSNNYWSGSELNASNAWNFNFNNGNQNNNDKNNNLFAWAVRSGG